MFSVPLWLTSYAHPTLAEFGSPLYLVFEDVLRSRFRRLKAAFHALGIHTAIAYSVKTNHLSELCRILREEGAHAEICSEFEYAVAQRAGFAPDQMVLNGPYKTEVELERLAGRALVNAESLEELSVLDALGRSRGCRFPVGLRIHFRIGEIPWSRFGFSLESGEAEQAAAWLSDLPGVELAGLHTHIGTNLCDVRLFAEAARTVCAWGAKLRDRGAPLKYIDLGGGLASPGAMPLKRESKPWNVPSFEDYAKAIAGPFLEAFPGPERPMLVVEPGRALVSEAGVVLTTVRRKKNDGEHCSIIVDAGVHLIPSVLYLKHSIQNVSRESGQRVKADIWGPLCMPTDCLGLGIDLVETQVGEILAVFDTGAYGFSQSMQFSRLRPAVILVSPDGRTRLLRRAETPQDVLRLEIS